MPNKRPAPRDCKAMLIVDHLRCDAANWKFIGDSEANTWLDRPRRDPWQLPKV